MSSLHKGHANLLYIILIWSNVSKYHNTAQDYILFLNTSFNAYGLKYTNPHPKYSTLQLYVLFYSLSGLYCVQCVESYPALHLPLHYMDNWHWFCNILDFRTPTTQKNFTVATHTLLESMDISRPYSDCRQHNSFCLYHLAWFSWTRPRPSK